MAIIIVDPNTLRDDAEKAKEESILNGIRYRLGTGITQQMIPDSVLIDAFLGAAELIVINQYNEDRMDKIRSRSDFSNLPQDKREQLILAVQYRIAADLLYSYKDVQRTDILGVERTYFSYDIDARAAYFLNEYNELMAIITGNAGGPPKVVVSTEFTAF